MKVTLRTAWLPLTAVTVMLVGALALVYTRTEAPGESDYFENVAVLRQLKQLDGQWDLEVFKAKIGITPSYDPLAASLTELSKSLEKLGAHMLVHNHDKDDALREGLTVLAAVIQEKAALIEQFKSSNAVLRNSLDYLPSAAQDVREATGRGREKPVAAGPISAGLDRVLLASLLYSRSASEERSDEIRRGLFELESLLPALGPELRGKIGVFGVHVRTVLREQKSVDDLLVQIAEVPTAARVDEIGNVLSGEQLQAEADAKRSRAYLLTFSSVLSALLLGAAVHLMRGHAAINRVNRELKGVNESLEHRVQERIHELRKITDAVPALIAYVDADRRFRFHNKACESVLGLTSDQIQGRTMEEVFSKEIYGALRRQVDQVLTGAAVGIEDLKIASTGGLRDFAVQLLPRHLDDREDGPVIGFHALFTDITEMKRIDRMKTEFVSTVSHELRTPLTSIRGSLGLVAGGVAGVLPDAAKGLIDIAKNNCERLIRLINDILDSEKIESGKMQFELGVVELRALVAHSIAANDGFAAQHGVRIALLTDGEPVHVNVNSDGLSQVLTNLLSNAVKFSPKAGSVDVSITRGRELVRVEVRDHGAGIPEEFRDRIFQKFSQADSSDSREKGGTGLGLSISKALVERLGGTIGFNAHAEGGTVFFFQLPIWQDKPAAISTDPTQGPKRPRVLVCEDDPDIARVLGMMLDRAGYDTDFAYNAAQAQDLATLRTYAAMTVDLKLPDENGISLIRTLRGENRTRHLPIVVVSANCEEGRGRVDSDRLTVSAWLDKPIDAGRLVIALREAVAGRVRLEQLAPQLV